MTRSRKRYWIFVIFIATLGSVVTMIRLESLHQFEKKFSPLVPEGSARIESSGSNTVDQDEFDKRKSKRRIPEIEEGEESKAATMDWNVDFDVEQWMASARERQRKIVTVGRGCEHLGAFNFTFDETNPSKEQTYSSGLHVITSFFRGTYQADRIKEILACFKKNLENPYIAKVHVLWQDENPRIHFPSELSSKLVTIKLNSQPTYSRFFSYANQFLKRGSIAIVTNSDIFFDETLKVVKFGPLPKTHPDSFYGANPDANWRDVDLAARTTIRTVYALSRRHAEDCGMKNDWKSTFDVCKRYIGSHDVFIFAPPTPCKVMANSNHVQNRMGSENVIIWGFRGERNFRVLNPCKQISARHLHCTNERQYPPRQFIHKGRYGVVGPGVPTYPINRNWTLVF